MTRFLEICVDEEIFYGIVKSLGDDQGAFC
jgi:hypothetical protein